MDLANVSLYLLEADQATGSTHLLAYISCVHCLSLCQSSRGDGVMDSVVACCAGGPGSIPAVGYSDGVSLGIRW